MQTEATRSGYTVKLVVIDNDGETNWKSLPLEVQLDMHIGDLDAVSGASRNTWTADVWIVAHTRDHVALGETTISGWWSDGTSATCITAASGECRISRSLIPKSTSSLTFSMITLTHPTRTYVPAQNHSSEGGYITAITVKRP
jgi:hypothetical protein